MAWKDFFKNKYIMLEISNVKVYDLKESVIACRNAMRTEMPEYTDEEFEKSLERAKTLAKCGGGSGHSNFRKGIRVSFDIKYPNYISPELQRYGFVDIVSSSSKMHRLMEMDLDFACNKYVPQIFIDEMRKLVVLYKEIKDSTEYHLHVFTFRDGTQIFAKNKQEALYYAFMECISACPQGIELFMRCSTNYEQLATIYRQRKNHKLKEDWGAFCDFIKSLPYSKELITMKD
jgi:hypothetical protein